MTGPNLRPAVRGLLIDPRDRVLLVRLQFDDWTGWVLPGGGKEPEEDDDTALRRELAEETGLTEIFIGPPLWRRRIHAPGMMTHFDGQEETVYLVPCRPFEIDPSLTVEQLRAEGLVEHRWFTVDELQATGDVLRPDRLADLVANTLEHGAPDEPLLIEEPLGSDHGGDFDD